MCFLVLLPTPLGTRQFVGAHNTIDAQMHVVGSIMFFWYSKCRCLPYCRTNVGAHNTVRVLTKVAKHPSGMACQYCPAGVQGTVLGIAVDLSALPYLLCLILGSLPSGRPRSVVPSRLRPRLSEKSRK